MQHPKCRTCGERHKFGPCPQIQNAPSVRLTRAPPVGLTAAPAAVDARAKFDRVSYQREYMRRWRAQRAAQRAKPAG